MLFALHDRVILNHEAGDEQTFYVFSDRLLLTGLAQRLDCVHSLSNARAHHAASQLFSWPATQFVTANSSYYDYYIVVRAPAGRVPRDAFAIGLRYGSAMSDV